MDIFLTIIAVVVIFSILVLIHEYGHFWAARRAGIKVLEFGIGFPPRIFKKRIGETLYSINAIPFGGFVKLFGEDASSEAILKNKRSYAHKSPWTRTKVVVAGVFMNLILAIVLLTVGFSFGIEPLLITEQDVFSHLAQGNIESAPGVFVSKLNSAAEKSGLAIGDKIAAIDDKPVFDVRQLQVFEKGKAKKDIDVSVWTAGGDFKKIHLPLVGKDKYFGADIKPFTEFPRLVVSEVAPNSKSGKAGFAAGDIILKMNGEEIYYPADFENVLAESSNIDFAVLRGQKILDIHVDLPDSQRVVIADVFDSSAAQAAGFNKGDVIISINGISMSTPQQVQEVLKKSAGEEMVYKILRNREEIEVKAKTGEKNILGIALSSIASYRNTEISVYRGSVITSILKINKVRYGVWKSFKQALSESARLTAITVSAFSKTIASIVSRFTVPADIGGPVQIAYYTHTFVQEGFFALLRFTALLSLSLGVINVLPIPALDGGRLLFIVVEVLFKKRVNARFEAMVHNVGFLLLLVLIILVTYSDITKLF